MNYCPETVIVHSSFLLADKKAAKSLSSADKRTCCELAQIVSGTIREVTRELLGEETCKRLDVEVRGLEFKLHSWIFSSLLSRYQQNKVDGSIEEHYFDSLPPLPRFGISFYLEVVKELQWENLLVECLCAAGLNNVVSLFDDLVKSLVQDPSLKNVSVFLYLFDSLLMSGTQSFQSEIIEVLPGLTLSNNSVSLLLIDGVGRLKNEIQDPAVKLGIIKNVMEFAFCTIVDLNFHVLSLDWMQQDTFSCENQFGRRRTAHVPDNDVHIVVVSRDFTACLELLCQLIADDWKETSCWIQRFCDSGSDLCVGQLDCVCWHPLHEWIVKLYGVLCLLITCSFDSKLMLQITKLHTGCKPYIEKYSTKSEQNWIDAFQRRELITQKSFEDEFSCPFESVDLLLFKPETLEEQYQFYLKRVDANLEGYNECFDWLLSAEEFHGEPKWLECMENHALRLSDNKQALKMVDIICMQHQALAVEKLMDDKVFRTMKKLLLSLFSTLPRSAQEEVVEYAVNVGSTQDSSEDSVFFHPWFESEEKASFQQELVLMFNKLVDVGSDEKLLQSVICDILKASLLSPHLTLNKMVQEGVKSAGHAKSICHVLQKVPLLCEFRDSSRTLLCHAVREAAMGVLSRQQELNLLNMVTVLLAPSVSGDTPLLKVDELLEAAVVPFLSETNSQGPIPTVRVLKLLHASFEALKLSTTNHLATFKEHFLPITLCLSELLNGCSVFWDGFAPDRSLSEMEELRGLVLTALATSIEMYCEVIKTNASFTRAVEWLLRRVKGEFDWTVLLHLEELLSSADIKYPFPVPCCLVAVCEEESRGMWISDADLGYEADDVFTVLFEYCRVSDVSLQKILESLAPHKLPGNPTTDNRLRVITSLAQVLPHCTGIEWQRILRFCQHLIKTNVLKVSGIEHVPWSWDSDSLRSHEAHQLSALLLETMETLRSPLCSSWATLHVWFHVTKHYVSAVKEITEGNTNTLVTAGLFAHVCHVMTILPADLTDKVFVLALDLVARLSLLSDDLVDHLKQTIGSLSLEVYKVALMQKLNQTASC